MKKYNYPQIKYKTPAQEGSWRNYQVRLKSRSAKRQSLRRIPRYVFVLCLLLLIIFGAFELLEFITSRKPAPPPVATLKKLEKSDFQTLLQHHPIINLETDTIDIKFPGRKYRFVTSIDTSLQRLITNKMDRKNSRYIGFLAMNPDTGQLLSMAGYDRLDQASNPCIQNLFPAASIFKIVTAAAAIEKYGFNENTRVKFNGWKYRLYKNQLKNTDNKYTNHLSFEKAFAESINPIVGKIGIHKLKKPLLEKYAAKFGFNQVIEFEKHAEKSALSVSSEPFNWAEIACGFNSETLITPLHGAMIASVVVNKGRLITPTIIDTATLNDKLVYRRHAGKVLQAIDASTANTLKKLMNGTVNTVLPANHLRKYKKMHVTS